MKCSEHNCQSKAAHIITQKRLGRAKPCRPLPRCMEHTPEWARKIGTGQNKYYTVEKAEGR